MNIFDLLGLWPWGTKQPPGTILAPLRDLFRFATPLEVASLVAYVASPLASATTGAALRVDGGVVKSAV